MRSCQPGAFEYSHFNHGLLTAISFPLKWEGTNADDQLSVTKDFVCLGVAWKETSFAPTWFGIATKSTLVAELQLLWD